MALHYSSTSSTSSSSMSPQARQPRRLLTEQDFRRNLEILGTISRPLSPTLPPSPPASPRPLTASLKRKRPVSDTPDEPESKRHHHDRRSEQPPKRVKSETAPSSANAITITAATTPASPSPPPQYKPGLPARKRKGPMPKKLADEAQTAYASKGKALKKSGEAHVAIGQPTDQALAEPYRRQRVFGTLQVTYALICFAFSFWLDEYKQGKPGMHWRSMRLLMEWTRPHWEKHAQGPKERAFLGFLYMLETFIEFRVQRQRMTHTYRCLDDQLKGRSSAPHAHPSIPSPLSSQPTPPTDNASPAASSPSSSNARGVITGTSHTPPNVNSTGGGGASNGHGHGGLPAAAPTPEATPTNLSIPLVAAQSMVAHLTFAQQLRQHHHHARFLSLPILQTHYPRTFHRVTGLVPTSLSSSTTSSSSPSSSDDYNLQLFEELEIHDLEKEEEAGGDFPYPSSSDGLVWVLLLGRSMIAEVLAEGTYPVVVEGSTRAPPS